MKTLITIVIFIFISTISFGQIPLKKIGKIYELSKVMTRDSIAVKELMDKFGINLSNLKPVKVFKEWELNVKLQDEYSENLYVYVIDNETCEVSMKSYFIEKDKPAQNKYYSMVCMTNWNGKNIINIKVY